MELYTEAAAVLKSVQCKEGSVKSLIFASNYKNVRQLYALVCESLKFYPILQTVFQRCPSLQQEETLQGQPALSCVLLYEHLVGKGLGRAGRIRTCIVKHKREIRDVSQALLEERGATRLADLLSSQCRAFNELPIPRYARVNLLKADKDDVISAFVKEGWRWQGALSLHGFRHQVEALGHEGFGSDPLVPDLLIFPPATDLHDHPLTESGQLVLQDRASCFPAHILNPTANSTVLDCCAAPGNKTTHVASLMKNSGKILAYERDAKRVLLLKHQLSKAGVKNARAVHQDFLSVDPGHPQFRDVEYIMVDPSCSGSGMIGRLDHVNHDNPDTTTTTTTTTSNAHNRLQSLQRFQISILKHALRFPAARRVVYSTCSVHREENEEVVAQVSEQVSERFRLMNVWPQFPHRGQGEGRVAERCVRTSPETDLTNGFFVACFERVEDGVEGPKVSAEGEQKDLRKEKKRKRKRKVIECDRQLSVSDASQKCSDFSSPDKRHFEQIADAEGAECLAEEEKKDLILGHKEKKKKKREGKERDRELSVSDVSHKGSDFPPTGNGLLDEEELEVSAEEEKNDFTLRRKEKKKKKRKRKVIEYDRELTVSDTSQKGLDFPSPRNGLLDGEGQEVSAEEEVKDLALCHKEKKKKRKRKGIEYDRELSVSTASQKGSDFPSPRNGLLDTEGQEDSAEGEEKDLSLRRKEKMRKRKRKGIERDRELSVSDASQKGSDFPSPANRLFERMADGEGPEILVEEEEKDVVLCHKERKRKRRRKVIECGRQVSVSDALQADGKEREISAEGEQKDLALGRKEKRKIKRKAIEHDRVLSVSNASQKG